MQDYRSSKAYQRSQRLDPYGTPIFPLPFARQRSEPLPAGEGGRKGEVFK